jgi:hypothetical protein
MRLVNEARLQLQHGMTLTTSRLFIIICVCVCVCSVYVNDARLQVKHGLTLTAPGLASSLASGMICFRSVRAFIES